MATTRDPLVHQITQRIATREGVDPSDLPPLFDGVDPEALDHLFTERESATSAVIGRVTFTTYGYHVTVYSDHRIEIQPIASQVLTSVD